MLSRSNKISQENRYNTFRTLPSRSSIESWIESFKKLFKKHFWNFSHSSFEINRCSIVDNYRHHLKCSKLCVIIWSTALTKETWGENERSQRMKKKKIDERMLANKSFEARISKCNKFIELRILFQVGNNNFPTKKWWQARLSNMESSGLLQMSFLRLLDLIFKLIFLCSWFHTLVIKMQTERSLEIQ